jgi:hypothetical protein
MIVWGKVRGISMRRLCGEIVRDGCVGEIVRGINMRRLYEGKKYAGLVCDDCTTYEGK